MALTVVAIGWDGLNYIMPPSGAFDLFSFSYMNLEMVADMVLAADMTIGE